MAFKGDLFGKKFCENSGRRKLSYRTEVEEFIVESKKCQILYANWEGFYRRRVMNLKEKNSIGNFIYYTIYFDGIHDWDNEQDFAKRRHVVQIRDRLIVESQKFISNEEIHFTVIWIYYFSHEDKTQKATPVFKIYKKESGSEAVFLDVSLNIYLSWNDYLDKAEFPDALLCIPRHGEYCFLEEGETLDLEFMCSRSIINRKYHVGTFRAEGFKPYSQTAVRPWLEKMKCFNDEKLKQMQQVVRTLFALIWDKMNGFLFNLCNFVKLIWLKLDECMISLGTWSEKFALECLMLLNNPCMKNLTLDFWPKHKTTFIENTETLLDIRKPFKDPGDETLSLLELLRRSLKNWREILKWFCLHYMQCRSVLTDLSAYIGFPPVLNKILFLLDVACKIMVVVEDTKSVRIEQRKNKALELGQMQNLGNVKLDISSMPLKAMSSSHPNENRTADLEPKFHGIIEKISRQVNNLPNLSISKTTFSEKAQKQLFEESFTGLPECSTNGTMENTILRLGEEDGYRFYFMPNSCLPNLTYEIGQLIGNDFMLKPRETMIFDVILPSGELVGTVFCPLKFYAVCLFSLEALELNKMNEEKMKN